LATITIVGAGMMGTALCWPAADRGHAVRLVGTPLDEEVIHSVATRRVHPGLQREVPRAVHPFAVADLEQAIDGADLIINGVSSFGIGWFTDVVGPLLRPGLPVLSVTKGLEDDADGTLVILPEVINRALPAHLGGRISLNAIGGPCTAHELAARRQTSVVFTGSDPRVLTGLRDLLATPYYRIWTSTDVVGVEVCAALKNAYALGVGLAVGQMEALGPDGLALAYNPQAALFGQACHEMRLMVTLLGGDPATVVGLPGAGDLYVTVFGGRTVRLGRLLGQGLPFSEAREILAGVTLESVQVTTRVARALSRLEQRGLVHRSAFPLLSHLDQIVNHAQPVDIPWDDFFAELDPGLAGC
jgi:glycerol-3-phosphate dehydrogenase (NAD(P)+)